MTARGVQAPRFTVRDRDKVLIPVPFSDLPTPYPYTLMISQAATEAVLLARLTELGGTVLRPTHCPNSSMTTAGSPSPSRTAAMTAPPTWWAPTE